MRGFSRNASEVLPLSDPTNDAPGEVAEKRVRRTRVAKAPAHQPAADSVPPTSAQPPAVSQDVPPAPAGAVASDVAGENAPAGQDFNNGGQGREGGQRMSRRERFKNRRERQRERYREGGLPEDGGNSEPFVPRPHPQVPEGFPTYSLGDLKRMPAPKLLDLAEQLQITDGVARARKQDIIFALLKILARHGEGVQADGVLEILPDGFGFLRAAEASYLAGPDDTYISPSQIRRFNLRTGDHISGRIRWPKDGERYFALNIVDTINGEPLEASKNKTLFENLRSEEHTSELQSQR